MATKKIGLLLGDENDWPSAYEGLMRRLPDDFTFRGKTHRVEMDRVRIHPFRLDSPTRYNVVIDRIGYWHFNPREWMKKAAFVNGTYMLNNPFTFQSMEKHTAYAAMLRLGLKVPETWMIPQKQGPTDKVEKYQTTAKRYHDLFNLKQIADEIGYPLYMKPFDGGGWRGVSRIGNEADLIKAYDESGQMLMHLQAGIEDFDVFTRSLGFGPQIMTMKYDPGQPQHLRYVIDHAFLSAEKGREARIITKTINAFFRWDFNSCEAILKNDILSPIDFANATPDVAITSLHYYFPWAMKALVAWSLFCAVSERKMHITMDVDPWFEIADSDRSYWEKLEAYEKLADAHLQKDEFEEFKTTVLGDLDEIMWHFAQSDEFDHIIIETVQTLFPPHEHDHFINHYRGLLGHWVHSNPV